MRKFTDKLINEDIELHGSDRLGSNVFLIVSDDEKFYVNPITIDNVGHEVNTIIFNGDERTKPYYWFQVKKFTHITHHDVNHNGYKSEEDASKYVGMFNQGEFTKTWKTTMTEFDSSTLPVRFIEHIESDWISDQITINKWKVIPFFVGAYRTDI